MKCKNCQTDLPVGAVYCPKCGCEAQIVSDQAILEDELLRFLIEDEGLQGKQSPQMDPVSNGQKEERPEETEPAAEKKTEKSKRAAQKKKKKRRRMLLVIVLIICAAAAVVGYRFYKINTYDYLYRKAQIACNTGSYEEALSYLEKALEKDPDSYGAWLLLAQAYENLGRSGDAQEAYRSAIERNPDSVDAWTGLLDLLVREGDYDSIVSLADSVDASQTEILELFKTYMVSVPEASLEGGTYNESLEIELTADAGDEIYYTLDGSDPETDGILYEGAFALEEEEEITLLAVSKDENGFYSEVLEETYEISYDAPDMPVASPDGGQFTEQAQVTLTAASGTTIYYTWDGSTPTTSSSKYSEPLDIPEGNTVLSAIAVDSTTGKSSGVFRSNFIYYPETESGDDAG